MGGKEVGADVKHQIAFNYYRFVDNPRLLRGSKRTQITTQILRNRNIRIRGIIWMEWMDLLLLPTLPPLSDP